MSGTEIWYLSLIAVVAILLALVSRYLWRARFYDLIALEVALLIGLLCGDLFFGHGESWRFNSFLLTGTMFLWCVCFGVRVFRPGLPPNLRESAVALRPYIVVLGLGSIILAIINTR